MHLIIRTGAALIKIVGTRNVMEVVSLFALVILLGFLIAYAAISTNSVNLLINSLSAPRFVVLAYLLDATIVIIIAMILLRKHSRFGKTVLYKSLEGVVMWFTSFFFFLLVFSMLIPSNTSVYYLGAILAAIALVLLKDDFPNLGDAATVISSIGVGLILGFNMNFTLALILLAAFAVYDYIGVFKTKEMVCIAKAFSQEDVAFLVTVGDIESVPMNRIRVKDAVNYEEALQKTHQISDAQYEKYLEKGRLPIASQISLGEGDLSLPLMIVVSSYYFLSNSILTAVIIAGAIAGIALTMLLLQRYKIPLPAIPSLFAVISIATGIGYLLSGATGNYVLMLIVLGAVVMATDICTIIVRTHRTLRRAESGKKAKAKGGKRRRKRKSKR
jgi:presenilin-like A22 family membrane protease